MRHWTSVFWVSLFFSFSLWQLFHQEVSLEALSPVCVAKPCELRPPHYPAALLPLDCSLITARPMWRGWFQFLLLFLFRLVLRFWIDRDDFNREDYFCYRFSKHLLSVSVLWFLKEEFWKLFLKLWARKLLPNKCFSFFHFQKQKTFFLNWNQTRP